MLVSVIIPTYNRKAFLEQAINSVLTQTYEDLEIIIIDDGSDLDNRYQKIESKDDRIKYFIRPHRGVAAARNFGVSVSSGEYLAFLDSDDLWDKRKLAKQMKYLQDHPEYKICYTNEQWLRNGKHLNQMKKHQKYQGQIFKQCLPLCIISASSILLERNIFYDLGGFDEKFEVCEDYELWLRMALRYPIAFLDEKLFVKRGGHPDQLSQKNWGMDRWRIRALEKLLKQVLTPEQKQLVLGELKKKYLFLQTGAKKRKRYLPWLYYKLRSIMFLR